MIERDCFVAELEALSCVVLDYLSTKFMFTHSINIQYFLVFFAYVFLSSGYLYVMLPKIIMLLHLNLCQDS